MTANLAPTHAVVFLAIANDLITRLFNAAAPNGFAGLLTLAVIDDFALMFFQVAEMNYYRQLGLRGRILGLPLMLVAVLSVPWRQVPSVPELSRNLFSLSQPPASKVTTGLKLHFRQLPLNLSAEADVSASSQKGDQGGIDLAG